MFIYSFTYNIYNNICDPSQQNRAVVCYQEKCVIPFIWKSILLTKRWHHSYVNWMQHCNFMVKNKSKFLFIFFVFSHTNGVISWNAFYRQLPCFDVMGHICSYIRVFFYCLFCFFLTSFFPFSCFHWIKCRFVQTRPRGQRWTKICFLTSRSSGIIAKKSDSISREVNLVLYKHILLSFGKKKDEVKKGYLLHLTVELTSFISFRSIL